jgi:hypothetical protein
MKKPDQITDPSRRAFLGTSAFTAAGTLAAVGSKTAAAQSTPAESVVNLGREKIIQFSLVVRDVAKVAKRFSEIFGNSWRLYDAKAEEVLLHNKPLSRADCRFKIGLGVFGGRSFKLIQPISDQSSYAEFLKRQGEGFYTIGLGTLVNHDQVVNALQKSGISVEMQGNLGNGSRFTIMETVEDLGCRIEFSSSGSDAGETNLNQTGTLLPVAASAIEMDKPVFSGGKKFNQVGIVVKDEKKVARRFEELLGIRGWAFSFGPPGLANAFLNEKPVPKSDMPSLDVAFANGWLGDIQIEVIRPLGIRPGGCHQWFLDKHGNGIQHLSFGLQPDYYAVVNALKRAGIGHEFSATLERGGDGVAVSYFAMQSQMGGFQLELVGRKARV